MRRRLPLVALLAAALAALSLGLAACGDDDDNAAAPAATTAPATSAPAATTAPAETTPAPAAATATVDADPSGQLAWVEKTLTVPAGTVTFTINNESSVPHNFEIPDASVGPSQTVTGGSTTLEADLQPGTYEYICAIPGHEQAGMTGTLTVE